MDLLIILIVGLALVYITLATLTSNWLLRRENNKLKKENKKLRADKSVLLDAIQVGTAVNETKSFADGF